MVRKSRDGNTKKYTYSTFKKSCEFNNRLLYVSKDFIWHDSGYSEMITDVQALNVRYMLS